MSVNARFVVIRISKDPAGVEFCQVALVGFDDEAPDPTSPEAYRFVFGRRPPMDLPLITYDTFLKAPRDLFPEGFSDRLEAEFRVGPRNSSPRNVAQVKSWLSHALPLAEFCDSIVGVYET